MSISRRVVLGLALVLLIALASQPLTAAPGRVPAPYGSDQKFVNGLWMLTFGTPAGQIRVNLPERLREGGLVSGSIELLPRGTGDALVANLAALKAHTLRIDGEAVSAASRTLRWRLATGDANGKIDLLDAGVAVASAPATLTPAGSAERGVWSFPDLVQRGHTFVIRGSFDGDLADTRVLIAGRPAEKVAESSELLVVRNGDSELGRVGVVVNEGGRRQRAAFNSFDIRLSAPQGAAAPGAEMSVQVRLVGLAGLARPFPLIVYNHSPEVVALAGGNSAVNRLVAPAQIGADGSFAFDFPTAVKRAGQASFFAAVAAAPGDHAKGVTWPPHSENVTFPPAHVANVTWAPHTKDVSFPTYHASNITWPPHTDNQSFPPAHESGVSWPPHQTGRSWPVVIKPTPTTPTPLSPTGEGPELPPPDNP